MPFTTRLNMKYGNFDSVWFLYSLNLALISFAILMIWRYMGKKKSLSFVSEDKNLMKFGGLRSLSTTVIFFLGGCIMLLPWDWAKWTSHFFFFLIFPVMVIIKKRYNVSIKK